MRTDADKSPDAPTVHGASSLRYAFSLIQPWATLLASGFKSIETRSWNTKFAGTVLIHASATWGQESLGACHNRYIRSALEQLGYLGLNMAFVKPLPRSAIIGVFDLVGTERTERIRTTLADQERAFGNYSTGRFAWRTQNQRTFIKPVPTRGALKLWEPTPAVRELCLVELGRLTGKEAFHVGAQQTGA
jgi:activating signal cointegrator 1